MRDGGGARKSLKYIPLLKEAERRIDKRSLNIKREAYKRGKSKGYNESTD
jgi:hypothetical protein